MMTEGKLHFRHNRRNPISRYPDTCDIINRPAFEQRLRAQFESQEFGSGQDPAWYALRNTVYAAGYRNMVSDGAYPSAFIKARTQAWQYFENSLSVHTELIYGRSGIASIQALAVIAFFSEGLGSPSMEYMLLTNAIHLTQSKGLHLQAKKSWKLRPEEVATRNALWWRLYTYDKLLASRSGRPSVIDDDDISCPSPTVGIGGSDTKAYLPHIVIKHAQISSLILKRLWSVKAMRQTPEEVLAVVQDLDQQLREWHSSLAPIYRNSPPYRPTNLPPGVHHYNVVFICFIYNSCLIAMHSLFSYPWGRPGSGASQDPRILAQKQRSSDIVASAAREIIMAVQDVRISAASPVWLNFFFPLLGLINLFLHVIQNPRLPTVDSDIALMDAIAGHFSYLEYASASQLGTHFPQKMVPYAREAVKRAWRTPTPQCAQQPTTTLAELLGPGLTEFYTDFPLSEFVTSELPEFTYDNWPTFISDLAETLL